MSEKQKSPYYVGVPAKGEAFVGVNIQDPALPAPSPSDIKATGLNATRLKENRLAFRVAKLGPEVVGFAGCGPVLRNGKSMSHGTAATLARLVVREEHRGNGLGTALISSAEEACRQLGFGMMVAAMSPAAAASATKAGWTVLAAGKVLTWIEPETTKELALVSPKTTLGQLPKIAGIRKYSSDPESAYPYVSYKIMDQDVVLKLVVSDRGADSTTGAPLAAAALAGSIDLSGLPASALLMIIPDIYAEGGAPGLLKMATSWASLNPEQAQWISSLFGIDTGDFAEKLVADTVYADGRK